MLHPGIAIAAVALFAAFCALEAGAVPHPAVKVALAQISVEDGDVEGNMRRAEEAVRQAAEDGCRLICISEAADWGWLYQEARRDAYPIPGRYTDFLADLAKELHVYISAGCLERSGEHTYNSAVLINPKGKIILKHRKIETLSDLTKHLYDRGDENDIKVVDTELGRIGITICADNFDIERPRKVADQGAWLLTAPHGFAAEAGNLRENAESFREHICKVAAKTKLWVLGTDTVMGKVAGGAWKGRCHSGRSTIADPDGNAVAVAKFLEPDLISFNIPEEK